MHVAVHCFLLAITALLLRKHAGVLQACTFKLTCVSHRSLKRHDRNGNRADVGSGHHYNDAMSSNAVTEPKFSPSEHKRSASRKTTSTR